MHCFIINGFVLIWLFSPQDIPLHAALLTHLLIAWDRMRWLNDPMNARFPAFVCCCATWLTGMVIALPYPIYTTYLDLGVSICFIYLLKKFYQLKHSNHLNGFHFNKKKHSKAVFDGILIKIVIILNFCTAGF